MLRQTFGQLTRQLLHHRRNSSISSTNLIAVTHIITNNLTSRSMYIAPFHLKETVFHTISYKATNASVSSKVTEEVTNEEQENILVIGEEKTTEEWQEIGNPVEEVDEFQGISLDHGQTGVFDIEDLVDILRSEKLQHIAVISVPKELQYVDYMVVTTGRSPRQMTAVAEFIRKIFKKRCSTIEKIPNIEGKDNKDWIALDLGNIALHIFSAKYRKIYDLETLWTCGAEYDELSNQNDNQLASLMESNLFTTVT